MGIFDKAKDLLSKNKEHVKTGVDKAGDMADDKTGGKHTEHIDKAEDAANKLVDGVADDGDVGDGEVSGAS